MRVFRLQQGFFSVILTVLVLALQPVSFALDTSRYIPIDEISTDMEAYCLSVFLGTEVEKFDLKILSVVRGMRPGQDMILVIGTDERFLKSSAVHGCSGSPVYIDGRMAGALAAGWDGSLEPLYLVRPINNMLKVGSSDPATAGGNRVSVDYDYSKPLDLEASYQQFIERLQNTPVRSQMSLPLSSSLPSHVIEPLNGAFEGAGLIPVTSASLLPSRSFSEAGQFEPGSVLAMVFCGGDISLSSTGTVTEVVGDQVFGFGHQFRGRGAVNYPIAAGIVHAVVASRSSSFKFASPGPILGTLEYDQTSAVRGTIGKMPQTIALSIDVGRYDAPERRRYDCYLAVDPDLTPVVLQAALSGAVEMQGTYPLEHAVRYSGQVVADGKDIFKFDNLSSQLAMLEASMEIASVVRLLLGNPFGTVKIDSIDVKVDLEPTNLTASVWAVNVSQVNVRPGQVVSASVVLRSYRSQDETVTIDFKIPETLSPGKYTIKILGPNEYRSFVSGMAPQKFLATDVPSLKTALNGVLQYRRDRLYAVMQTPASGLVIRRDELGQLPPTKMLLMQDRKRLLPLEAYKEWTESSIPLDNIVSGKAEIEITVER